MENKKRLAPKLRFPNFNDEWITATLGDYIEEIAMGPFGSNLKVEMFQNTGVPIIKGGNLLGGRVSGPYSYVSEEKANSLGKSIALPGDFIVTHRGTLGQIAEVPSNEYPRYVTSQSQLRFRINSLKIDNGWLGQYFVTKRGIRRLLVDAGQVGVPAISFPTSSLKKVVLVVPSLWEQQEVSQFLMVVDEKVESMKHKIDLLKKYKKCAANAIFSQQIRFLDDSGKKFPDWDEKRLGDLVKVSMGQSPESSAYNNAGHGMYLIQGNADIKNRRTLPRLWTKNITKTCSIGDIILTVRAPSGYVAMSDHDACIGRGVSALRAKIGSDKDFLFQFLLWFEPKWAGIEQGSTFTAINSDDIKSVRLKCPNLKEQQKIADFLTTLDDKIKLEEIKLERVKTFKKALLQQMFV